MSGEWAERFAAQLAADYGAEWSGAAGGHHGLASDLLARGHVDGLDVVGCELDGQVVICQVALARPLADLQELNARAYALLGLVAEDLALVERTIGAETVEYAFIIGGDTHGHRGKLIVTGANLPAILRAYDRRLLAQGAETLRLGARHHAASVEPTMDAFSRPYQPPESREGR